MKPFTPIFICLALLPTPAARGDDAGVQFFESKIRPVLVDRCYSCHAHTAKKVKGGLYLDSRDALLKGGETGPSIVPGHPEKSRLIEAIDYKNVDLQMPPKDKLTDAQIADFAAWVKMGAPWGKESAKAVAKAEEFDLAQRKAAHWAWHPVKPHAPPAVKDAAWPTDPIDRFVLAKLEAHNLAPAPDADRRALLRRVHFDLVGLPPKPRDVDAFVNDASPDALAAVVDRLLASPQFGERWARHWLDLVRYAETMGHEFDFPIPNAWRYRDYVIRAFNADLPYDRFVTEQVAGDLLPDPRRHPATRENESALGTAFWFLGEDVQAPVDVRLHQADLLDNRIDVLGKAVLGLTIACARCHDHKFDAISTADYYALYGYLKGARYTQAPLNQPEIDARARELRALKSKIRTAAADQWLRDLPAAEPPPAAKPAAAAAARAGDHELFAHRPAGWAREGSAFDPAAPGDFLVGDAAKPVAALVTEPGSHGALLSRRLEGALRSPTFTIAHRYLHLRAAGAGARANVVVDNFNVIRDPIYGGLKRTLKSDAPAWVTVDLAMWKGRQAYVELADTTVADPGGPASPADAWASLHNAILSDHAKPPPAPSGAASDGPHALRAIIESWRDGSALTPAAAARLAHALDNGLLKCDPDALAHHVAEYRRLEQSLPAPTYAPAATDADAGDEHVFIRGNPKTLGPVVPRRFLEALDPAPTQATGSGRLDLARRIASPANPLPARVMANRIWHHLLGRGLVASVDNFGQLGDPPTHPELLDHLAARFADGGWSTKRLIRAIVLSRTYRMASRAADPAAAAPLDPDNKLLHRAHVRRLQAETIRDHLLAVSGRLDLTAGGTGGPGVPVHLTPFMDGRGKPTKSGPLDGAGRRSVYLEVRRNFLPPMLLAFDTPQPFSTMGRRSVSNVPAQALILMNDPFVQEQAKLWAAHLLADPSTPTPESRVAAMYAAAFSRPPAPDETAALLAFAHDQGEHLGLPKDQRLTDPRIWTEIAHALINTKEFIFLN
jgi:cytochrome c553